MTTMDAALEDLLCHSCRQASSRSPVAPKVDGIIRAEVVVPGSEDQTPLLVKLGITRIEFVEVRPGYYTVRGVALIDCPGCGTHHPVKAMLKALPIHLTHVGECSCGGHLEFQNTQIQLIDEGEEGPLVEVKGTMVCRSCRASQDATAQCAGADVSSVVHSSELEIDISTRRVVVTPERGTAAESVQSNNQRAGDRSADGTATGRTEGKREGAQIEVAQLAREIIDEPFNQCPMLRWAMNSLKRDLGPTPLAGLRTAFVLHLLTDLLPFVEACKALGLSPSGSVFFYKSEYQYPHRESIISWMREQGFDVRPVEGVPSYIQALELALNEDSRGLMIVEDGGYAVPLLHRNGSKLAGSVIGAVEQTTKGLRLTEDWAREVGGPAAATRDYEGLLRFPLLSIPDSKIKQKVEPPIIGNQVVHCIQALSNALSVHGTRVALLGLGTIGMEVFKHLRAVGARVTGYDATDEGRRSEFIMNGGDLAGSATQAVRGKRLVIGCSGRRSVTADVIAALDHGACVVSASSDLVEIDRDYLESLQVIKRRFGIKDQHWDEGKLWAGTRYLLAGTPQKEVNLLADGYPVTFWGFPGMPHQGGDLIMTVILVAAAELAARNGPRRAAGSEPYPNRICRQAVDEIGDKYRIQSQYLRQYYPETRG